MGLTRILQISRRIREASRPEEVAFIAVNESKQLVHYRQAALWLEGVGVIAVSGIPEPDQNAPFILWLKSAFREWGKTDGCRKIEPSDLPSSISATWIDWLPTHGAIVPLAVKDGKPLGMLLLARDEVWSDQELAVLQELCAIYAHGFSALHVHRGFVPRVKEHLVRSKVKYVFLLILAGLLFLPVSMSVQAPAEVVPKDPFIIRSPLDGVIDRFYVRPNASVKEGDLLFSFDQTNLRARVGVTAKAFEVAAEEYRQAAQTALLDEKSRTEVAPRLGRMQEKATEFSYSRELYNRLMVRTPRAGIAVFAEESDWIGRSVSIGEKVLVIADPDRVEILIYLPVADAIELNIGTPVSLYLAMDAQHPLEGKLRYAAYKPEITPAGFVAYRLKADFDPGIRSPRIGLTGTARIYGEKVFLGYYLFRRPLAFIRQNIGW